MRDDRAVTELVRQWQTERAHDPDFVEISQIASEWLADSSVSTRSLTPGIPGQRVADSGARSWSTISAPAAIDPRFIAAMQKRLPDAPYELLEPAASCWQMAGSLLEAQQWWDAGISPLDQRALEYRAAGLSPSDLSRRLGPMTVLEHLRRGSAPAWCVIRLQRQQRRDSIA